MNIQSLSYFLVVAEELSFTKASKRLYVSQQSLSNHIQRLEEYFGTTLFLRTVPLTLTPSGDYLYKEAKKLLSAHDNLRARITDIKDYEQEILKIGTTHSRARSLLPAALKSFHLLQPAIRIHLYEGSTPQVEEQLRHGHLDLSIGYLPSDTSNIHSIPLYDDIFLVVVPVQLLQEHFGEQAQTILQQLDQSFDPHLLKNLPFLTLTAQTKLSNIFTLYMEENDLNPDILLETPNLDTLLAMCYEGLGVIICPASFLERSPYDKSRLRCYPIESSYSRRSIVINYPSNRYLSSAASDFIRIVKEVFASAARSS